MFAFLTASHRSDYISLGLKFRVWPERVYRLAHGGHSTGDLDRAIRRELCALGIIRKRRNQGYDEEQTVFFDAYGN